MRIFKCSMNISFHQSFRPLLMYTYTSEVTSNSICIPADQNMCKCGNRVLEDYGKVRSSWHILYLHTGVKSCLYSVILTPCCGLLPPLPYVCIVGVPAAAAFTADPKNIQVMIYNTKFQEWWALSINRCPRSFPITKSVRETCHPYIIFLWVEFIDSTDNDLSCSM